ncbi:dATP pyrophosphohydrolase [Cyclonatronum proteinivorum]|uniref:dATP pyrophosphohydrolase n=2 Tax=Cyclonatronum proteinivorum TaxID=1457365 RepID=A0A345UIX2_9BACT|nr:dATP pyrophosphohydrolase [Cyclonatronum proteinivorum]
MSTAGIEFLLMRRAKGKLYEGQWRMVGGKVKPAETAAMAAFRELDEETGLIPTLFWCVPSLNAYFDFKANTVHHIAVFACCCETNAVPLLNYEHDQYDWFTADKAALKTRWPEQQRLIQLITRILQSQTPLPPEWVLSHS